jgi:hypothetical protein
MAPKITILKVYYREFPQSCQPSTMTTTKLEHERFLTDPFQFKITSTFYLPKLYKLSSSQGRSIIKVRGDSYRTLESLSPVILERAIASETLPVPAGTVHG